MKPETCPVCGKGPLEPVERRAVVRPTNGNSPISGVLAYRCPEGHFFVSEKAKAASESR
ncbi:MAG: hypothetical protein JOY79_00300 [Acidobacteriaceae bacterium]|nr:hypothetical protein [Acidobacteriaceae bacterium]